MLSKYVKETRLKRGLSQAELAKLSGLSPAFICRIEKGDYKSVTVDSLSKLSRALKVSVGDLSNLVLNKGIKEDLIKKTPYEIMNELTLSLPVVVPVYPAINSRQVVEYVFVPRELAFSGGKEMKLIGIKSNDLEYEDIVHKGDIVICGKDFPPSPGDLCIILNDDQISIGPYNKKEKIFAVILQVVRVVKKLV